MIDNKNDLPAQHQNKQPGIENKMSPIPESYDPNYQGSNKLQDKVAIITGGDSGIGRSIAIYFAIEGAKVAIAYLDEHEDAKETQQIVEAFGQPCLLFRGDITDPDFSRQIIDSVLSTWNELDIIVNNAAMQFPKKEVEEISFEQVETTFKVNVFAYFYLIKAALPYLKEGSCIINTTSVTAYKGSAHLIDYSASKGAIVSLTRSLSQVLVKKGIRVNAVAPGPVWTPLIPASFSAEEVKSFGKQVPMQRAAEPKEIAPCYVFLASSDASYITGQVLHPNGGVIVNG